MLGITPSVAICGAPLVGKREILNRLAQATDSPYLDEEERQTGERIVRLRIVREELARSRRASLPSWEPPVRELELRLVSGAMLFKEPVIRTVIGGVSMICYVAAAEEAGPGKSFQKEYLQTYLNLIRENRPPEISWTWVLNKVDHGSTNPLEQDIPQGQRVEVIRTVAVKGAGIGLVWKKILDVIQGQQD